MTPTAKDVWRAAHIVRAIRQESRNIEALAVTLPPDVAAEWLLLVARAMTVSEETSTADFVAIADDYAELAAKRGLIVPLGGIN